MAMGRPKIQLNWDDFDDLCAKFCTLEEIAGYFDCSADTVEIRVKEQFGCTFSEHYKRKCSPGKVSLRRKQFELAMAGDKTMLIWLGKQYLGQTEKMQTTYTAADDKLVIHFGGKNGLQATNRLDSTQVLAGGSQEPSGLAPIPHGSGAV